MNCTQAEATTRSAKRFVDGGLDARSTGWKVFTLRGWHSLSDLLDTAVCHVSFFEAGALVKWRSCRLPTEAEWEAIASSLPVEGTFLEADRLHRGTANGTWGHRALVRRLLGVDSECLYELPGLQTPGGPLGEYNAKFMSPQMILRGGSCVRPAYCLRATYRNFFLPVTRWQFSGIHLAT